MSETEHYGVLDSGETITPEDIRELTGAVTPHFSLQVRNRVRRLIEPLAADDPARILDQRQRAGIDHHLGAVCAGRGFEDVDQRTSAAPAHVLDDVAARRGFRG